MQSNANHEEMWDVPDACKRADGTPASVSVPAEFGRSCMGLPDNEALRREFGSFSPIFTIEVYTANLTRMIMEESKPDRPAPLYVSVGEADFCYAWLSRLYAEAKVGLRAKPEISQVVIKSPPAIFMAGNMQEGSIKRLMANLDGIKLCVGAERVKHENEVWSSTPYPPFHGYLFGDQAWIGPWARSATDAHVRNFLIQLRKKGGGPAECTAFKYVENQFKSTGRKFWGP